MLLTEAPSVHPLAAKFASLMPLSRDEIATISALPTSSLTVRAGQPVLRAGDFPTSLFLILEGFVSTSKEVTLGKRQIMSIHLPGDLPVIFSRPDRPLDVDVIALSACKLATIEASAVLAACQQFFRIGELLWECALAVASIHREWIINVGHRPAGRRLAHLLCEIMVRLEASGLAKDKICDLPLTQLQMSQATGLTRIHLNRACQELKKLGLISWKHGKLTIHDWETLARLGQFSPEYLCLPMPRWKASPLSVQPQG